MLRKHSHARRTHIIPWADMDVGKGGDWWDGMGEGDANQPKVSPGIIIECINDN